MNILPPDIMSDNPGAPRQTFLKIVGHVRRDQRISGSLNFRAYLPMDNAMESPFRLFSGKGVLFVN